MNLTNQGIRIYGTRKQVNQETWKHNLRTTALKFKRKQGKKVLGTRVALVQWADLLTYP